MNWLVIAVIVFLMAMVVAGYRKGFVKIAFGLLSMIIALVLVSALAPSVQSVLTEHTSVHEKLSQACSKKLESQFVQNEEQTTKTMENVLTEAGVPLPTVMVKVIKKATVDQEASLEKLGATLSGWILYGISFLVTFILIIILLRFVGGLLDLVTKLPLIKGTNRLLGCCAGLIEGLLFLWLGALVLSVFCTTEAGQQMVELVNESKFLQILYNHNGIIYLAALFI